MFLVNLQSMAPELIAICSHIFCLLVLVLVMLALVLLLAMSTCCRSDF